MERVDPAEVTLQPISKRRDVQSVCAEEKTLNLLVTTRPLHMKRKRWKKILL